MNDEHARSSILRLGSTVIIAALLGTLGCNSMLGIDDPTCVDDCDEDQDSSAGGARSSSGRTEPDTSMPAAAGGSLGAALPSGSVAPGASSSEVDSVQQRDDLIAAQCAQQASTEPFCVGNARVVCGSDGAAATIDVCASGDHCARGIGAECAACSVPSFLCQGAELWGCDSALEEMVLIDTCVGAASCHAAAGRCDAPACEAGERRCQGTQLQECAASRTGFELR